MIEPKIIKQKLYNVGGSNAQSNVHSIPVDGYKVAIIDDMISE
jgi:hypothetical protein